MNSKTQIQNEFKKSCEQFDNIVHIQLKKKYTSPSICILGEVRRLTAGAAGEGGFDVFTNQASDLS